MSRWSDRSYILYVGFPSFAALPLTLRLLARSGGEHVCFHIQACPSSTGLCRQHLSLLLELLVGRAAELTA